MGGYAFHQLQPGHTTVRLPFMHDELDAFIAEICKDPEVEQAYREASERDLEERPCSHGNCTELWDRATGENTGGWGPVGCPCQNEET